MSCCVCSKSKTTLVCGACKGDLCKGCTEFLDSDAFSFLINPPEPLSESAFCSACFSEQIVPALDSYNKKLEAAKQILVFDKTQGKETRLLSRLEPKIIITECLDKAETIMRLAFCAAELGFNAIIDVDLKPKKIKDGKYQHTVWDATAIPANVIDGKLIKDRSNWSDPN